MEFVANLFQSKFTNKSLSRTLMSMLTIMKFDVSCTKDKIITQTMNSAAKLSYMGMKLKMILKISLCILA